MEDPSEKVEAMSSIVKPSLQPSSESVEDAVNQIGNVMESNNENQELKPVPATSPGPVAADLKEKEKEGQGSSSRSSSGATSPEPNCPICLGKMENKSFTNSCCHQFCFTCLLEWSKVKPQCPLCKQPFKSIVHSVRSNDDYARYDLIVEEPPPTSSRRFRYRTTMTRGFRSQRQTLMLDHYTSSPRESEPSRAEPSFIPPRFVSDFRRQIYEYNHWVQPVSRNEGVRRTDTAFFSANQAMSHRLVPWLNRELNALGCNSRVAFIIQLVLQLIQRYHILSPEFYERMRPFIGNFTRHFVHEFYHFARSPFDMTGYDRTAVYPYTAALPLNLTNDSSEDSEVEVVGMVDGGMDGRPPWSRLRPTTERLLSRAREFLQSYSSDDNSPQVIPIVPAITLSPQPGPSGFSNVVQEIISTDEDDEEMTAVVNDERPTVIKHEPAAATSAPADDEEDIVVLDPPPRQPPEVIVLSDDDDENNTPQAGPSTSVKIKIKMKQLPKRLRVFNSDDESSSSLLSSSSVSQTNTRSSSASSSSSADSSANGDVRKRKSKHSKRKKSAKSKSGSEKKKRKKLRSNSGTDDSDSGSKKKPKHRSSHRHHKHKSKKSKASKVDKEDL